jgi:hypothetical protein
MPTPKGRPARITVYVNADHAHNQLTRQSVSGVIMFVNNMPIRWICKRQKTVETSTYGSELVAGRMAMDLIVAIRYELRMLGVPLDGPALLLGDNMSVDLNTTVSSSVLKKKHCLVHAIVSVNLLLLVQYILPMFPARSIWRICSQNHWQKLHWSLWSNN